MKLLHFYKLIILLFFLHITNLSGQIQQFSKIQPVAKNRIGNRIIDSNNEIRAEFRLNESKYSGNREAKARAFLAEKIQRFLGKTVDNKSSFILEKTQNHPAASHLRFFQEYDGIPVYQSDIVVSFTKNETISMLMSNYKSSIQIADIIPTIDQNQSISIAKNYLPDQSGILGLPQSVLMILDNANDDRLIYKVNLPISNSTVIGDFEFLIDAKSLEILSVRDLQKNHRKNDSKKKKVTGQAYVYNPNPLAIAKAVYGSTGFTDNGDATNDSLNAYRSLVTLNDLKFDAGNYSLQNEFVSLEQIEMPLDTFPQLPDSNGFQFTRDQQEFEAVNVFYHIDKSRRYLESLGFTDINPNNQPGLNGPKSLRVDPHGLNGDDNSHFFPSNDHLCWGEGGVDDAEDADVIWHEFGHAIQDFIVPFFNGNEGLGEGFSDYWANSYYRSTSNWTSSDPQYNYVFGWDGHNPFWPGRTTNLNDHYSNLGGSVHQMGQFWSTPLMRIYDRVGRNVMDQLVIKSHYYLTSNANQVENAEAVLQADNDLFMGTYKTIIEEEFIAYGQIVIIEGDSIPLIIDSIPDIFVFNPPAENDTIDLSGRYFDEYSETLQISISESSDYINSLIVDNKIILNYPVNRVSVIPIQIYISGTKGTNVDQFFVHLVDTKPPKISVYTELNTNFDQTGSFLMKTSFSEALTDNPKLKLETTLTDTTYDMVLNTSSGFYETTINIGESDTYQFTAYYADIYGNNDSTKFEKTLQFIDPTLKSSYQLSDSITLKIDKNTFNRQFWLNINRITASIPTNLDQISAVYNITSTISLTAGSYVTLEMIVPANSKADKKKIGLYLFDKTPNWLYQGGESINGLVKADVESFGSYALLYNDKHQYLAQQLELNQNYPNPFNPSTTIQVKLDSRTRLVIDIFNSLGQRVKRLIDKDLPRKNHNFIWDGTNQGNRQLPSGIYFYQVKTNYSVLTKKMVLIR